MNTENKTKRILVIDDDEICRRTVSNILGESGYEVSQAEDGQDGLQAALSDPPDLIICDVDMPKLNGFEVVAKLRADAKTEAIPVIFVTGLVDQVTSEKARAAGAVDIFIKPFELSELLASVKVALARLGKTRKPDQCG